MSVLINMEMPTSCEECPLGDSLHCQVLPSVPALWAEYTNAIREKRRHSECPLVPVPPHGRLIDADALAGLFRAKVAGEKGLGPLMVNLAALCIGNATTIIPASEEEDNDRT